MKVLSGVYWNAGAQKEVNQDTIVLQQVVTPRGRVVMALVCDGIGGLPQGEIASGYAAEQIIHWFSQTGLSMIIRKKGRKPIKRSILRVFFQIQEDMHKYGTKNNLNIGSTVTLLLLWGNRYMAFHLGDSRIYFCRKSIRQLTMDHCNAQGALTKCTSSFFWQRPDILQGRILRNSGFLLCTDGFRNRITGRQLEEALYPGEINEEKQIETRLKEIAEYSMKKGEKDNISAIYIKVIK